MKYPYTKAENILFTFLSILLLIRYLPGPLQQEGQFGNLCLHSSVRHDCWTAGVAYMHPFFSQHFSQGRGTQLITSLGLVVNLKELSTFISINSTTYMKTEIIMANRIIIVFNLFSLWQCDLWTLVSQHFIPLSLIHISCLNLVMRLRKSKLDT